MRQKEDTAKFERLQQKRSSRREIPTLDRTKVIVNLSKKSLSRAETEVLEHGLNFAVPPKEIPSKEIIAKTETLAKRLDPTRGKMLQRRVQECLDGAKAPKANLTREQSCALKELEKDKTIVVLPADKGNATVIMDRTQYNDKMNEILSDVSYKPLTKDPSKKTERQLTQILKELESCKEITSTLRYKLNPQHSTPAQLYGVPKIHKEGVPMRPIVSTMGSATYGLAKELTRILAPLVGNTERHVRHSAHFVQRIRDIRLQETDTLVSFDVVSLFTRVPIDEAMQLED